MVRGCAMRRYTELGLFLVAAAAIVVFWCAAMSASPAVTERVSVDSGGNEANGSNFVRDISADGRYVAFQSSATNLVPEDTNNLEDLFVHDRQTGATERLSVDSDGKDANGGGGYPASINADGRYVAFGSDASNLVPNDTNTCPNYPLLGRCPDIFVRDRETGTTVRVSVDGSGNEANGFSSGPFISPDGRYVVFESQATNLVTDDTNAMQDVFVHDRDTDEDGVFDEPGAISTERASVHSDGSQGNDFSYDGHISADGRYVVFSSSASTLVSGDTNTCYTEPGHTRDVFVHDRQTGVTVRVSVDSSGNQLQCHSDNPSLSANGRYVAFRSDFPNIPPWENTYGDVLLHDRDTDEDGIFDEPGAISTERVSVDSDGDEADNHSQNAAISADGRDVTFDSDATNLVEGDSNGRRDVFVHDVQTGITQRVSLGNLGGEAHGQSGYPSISSDGRYVAFVSGAADMVAGDTNGVDDVFVRDRQASPVGGIAEYPQLEPGASRSSGSSARDAFALAFGLAGGTLLLTAAGWYARRRRVR